MSTGTRPAKTSDVDTMQDIGALAGMRFAQVDDPRIAACADDDPVDSDELRTWIDGGHAWVALDDDVVAWNRPYYERRGFRILTSDEIGRELSARVAEEEAHGLLAELRVCMGRPV